MHVKAFMLGVSAGERRCTSDEREALFLNRPETDNGVVEELVDLGNACMDNWREMRGLEAENARLRAELAKVQARNDPPATSSSGSALLD